jgi:hypothetical protein
MEGRADLLLDQEGVGFCCFGRVVSFLSHRAASFVNSAERCRATISGGTNVRTAREEVDGGVGLSCNGGPYPACPEHSRRVLTKVGLP